MTAAGAPTDGPAPESLQSVFRVYEVREEDEKILYFGNPAASERELVRTAWPLFREEGYEVSLTRRAGEFVLVAEPLNLGVNGVPWTNILLFGATVLTTLFAGNAWYYVFSTYDVMANPLVLAKGLPFTLAVLGVLGTHELGHYLASRYHGVAASLPYFIPMTPPFGTMGAVIRMRGKIPDRRALFDIGVAGPIAGLVATVAVTAVGLTLPPITVPEAIRNAPAAETVQISFGYPLLLRLIADALGETLYYEAGRALNPVVLGGWIGMFVTFLNLLPVGQLDGGHVMRAIVGPRQRTAAVAVPVALLGLAGYLHYARDVSNAVSIWVFWGLISGVLAYLGPVDPIEDDDIGGWRIAVGVLTFAVGLLCFTPVPIRIVV